MTTTASLLTPAGRGAIATIRIRGSRAVTVADLLFVSATNRKIETAPIGRILFGNWQSTNAQHEELVVCRTKQDEVEVQCHGGPAAIDAILDSLKAQGCDIVEWQATVRYENLVASEARIALAGATTERAAAILLAQLNGNLKASVHQAISLAESDADNAVAHIDEMLRFADIGQHLTTPWQVVIAGPPNVGKSSLINALLGFDRAIVFDQPGTTRDVVASVTAFDGWPVELSDTAGIRTSTDQLEMAGVQMAREQFTRADLIVDVRSADQWSSDSHLMLDGAQRSITVINKCDLVKDHLADPFPESAIQTVATARTGIRHLIRAIVDTLIPIVPGSDDAVPFTDRQVRLLSSGKELLVAGKIESSLHHLNAILVNNGG